MILLSALLCVCVRVCAHVLRDSHCLLIYVPEMTGPIHEMTRNNHQREPLPFAPISRHEKVTILVEAA